MTITCNHDIVEILSGSYLRTCVFKTFDTYDFRSLSDMDRIVSRSLSDMVRIISIPIGALGRTEVRVVGRALSLSLAISGALPDAPLLL